MTYFKRKNIFQSILFSRGMALGILLAIVFVSYGLVSIVGKGINASRARKEAEGQALDLKTQDDALSQKLSALATPDGQEAALREKYPLVKDGEHVIVITNDQGGAAAAAPQASVPSNQEGFLDYVKSLLSNK